MGIIYMATCLAGDGSRGKRYVGQTFTTLEERVRGHLKDANSPNLMRRKLFQSTLRKYNSPGDWKWEILEENVPDEMLDEREIFWIAHFNTIKPNGLNLRGGGAKGRLHAETKEKLRLASIEFFKTHPGTMTGKHHSESAIAAMREKRTGTKASEETRAKMSIQRKGKKLPPFSDEHRAKLSAVKLGDRHPFWGKDRPEHSMRMAGSSNPNSSSIVREIDNRVFLSVIEAANEMGLHRSTIFNALNQLTPAGKRKTAGGSLWHYVRDEPK